MNQPPQMWWPDGGPRPPRGPRRWPLVLGVALSTVLLVVGVVAIHDSLELQRSALGSAVREQCTTSLSVKLQVGFSYSITLGTPRFDGPGAVTSSYVIQRERLGGQARLGNRREGRVRCRYAPGDDGALRVISLEVLS